MPKTLSLSLLHFHFVKSVRRLWAHSPPSLSLRRRRRHSIIAGKFVICHGWPVKCYARSLAHSVSPRRSSPRSKLFLISFALLSPRRGNERKERIGAGTVEYSECEERNITVVGRSVYLLCRVIGARVKRITFLVQVCYLYSLSLSNFYPSPPACPPPFF